MQLNCDQTFLKDKRFELVEMSLGGIDYVLRDQAPLYSGNISFETGWGFDRFIEELNQYIFFWPGNEENPIRYGQNHFMRYLTEDPVVLKVSTKLVFAKNTSVSFCKYNSGAPRCNAGQGSPRGSDTFMPSGSATFKRSDVKEVVFHSEIKLPDEIIYKKLSESEWKVL